MPGEVAPAQQLELPSSTPEPDVSSPLSYVGGGWDDVVANPHLPLVISPQKSSRGESTCEGISRGRRNRRAIIEEQEDEGSASDSDDSGYDPKELVDSDYCDG
ncbi:hypothetical protein ZWY2020_009784 [Hordeum vulgare]|nr:hypothetical protein ZWY2020_009784 [Hordeum vulgare]